MKYFTFCFLTVIVTVSLTAQDTIRNPGMEKWSFHGYYRDPDGWTTFNALTGLLPVITAYQDSVPAEVHSGKFSIKLITKKAVNDTPPGMLTTGKVNTTLGIVEGGIPINSRPSVLKGWYQYFPAGPDTASMEIHLFKWNSRTMSHDEIGTGVKYVSDSAATWTSFSVPVNYVSASVPDTVLMVFWASNRGPKLNTTLILDDLNYDFSSGIPEEEILPAKVYPNPFNDLLQVSWQGENEVNTEINLYSSEGKLVRNLYSEKTLAASFNQTFNVSELSCGAYLLQISSGNKRSIQRVILQ